MVDDSLTTVQFDCYAPWMEPPPPAPSAPPTLAELFATPFTPTRRDVVGWVRKREAAGRAECGSLWRHLRRVLAASPPADGNVVLPARPPELPRSRPGLDRLSVHHLLYRWHIRRLCATPRPPSRLARAWHKLVLRRP